MAVQQSLQSVPLQSLLPGFANLYQRESRKWWRTRRWWIQALLWLALLNGFVVFGLFVMPGMIEQSSAAMEQATANGAEVMTGDQFRQDVPNALFGLATFLLPVGVIIVVQGQVYAEKRSGVAAWILSKPASRAAYLMAKLFADAIGIIVVMVVIPLLPAYLLLSFTLGIHSTGFITASLLLILLLMFYHAVTLLMSVLGNSIEIVLGVPLGMLLGGMILKTVLASLVGNAIFWTPWALPDVITLTVTGQPLPPPMQITIFAVPLLTLVCITIALWQFQRQEL
jgi:ABC-2 type transport system permease protein